MLYTLGFFTSLTTRNYAFIEGFVRTNELYNVYTYTYALKKFYDILIIASDIHSKKAKKIIFNKKLLAELFLQLP